MKTNYYRRLRLTIAIRFRHKSLWHFIGVQLFPRFIQPKDNFPKYTVNINNVCLARFNVWLMWSNSNVEPRKKPYGNRWWENTSSWNRFRLEFQHLKLFKYKSLATYWPFGNYSHTRTARNTWIMYTRKYRTPTSKQFNGFAYLRLEYGAKRIII